MSQKILQAHIDYKDGQLNQITVLVEISTNDVRCIAANTVVKFGYIYINPEDPISPQLLQRVADEGHEITNADKIFPNWEKKYEDYLKSKGK